MLKPSIDRGLKWIETNLTMFRLTYGDSVEETLKLLKPLGELILVLEILIRRGVSSKQSVIYLEWCWEQLQQGKLLAETLLIRPDLIVAATIYAPFKRQGMRCRQLDDVLSYLNDSVSATAVELPTWRRLDVAHGLSSLGLRPFPMDEQRLTWLSATPEPWTITNDIAYATTHNVFYITDFGRMPSRLDLAAASYLETWLPSWLAIYQRQSNWDLYAEFVMCAACIDKQSSFEPHVAVLVQQQDSAGMVPGPAHSAESLIKSHHSSDRVSFLRNYHTTLVSLLAFVLMDTATDTLVRHRKTAEQRSYTSAAPT